ncbi:alpha/beta hydrolase [Streptomyces sp. DSM 44915]|uniref:Alpha/beta hydrolase n=1 Tax=Streptomyces chisholmiae TaxID=3075540 RepID=A0ABU2JMW3_9ACTN|nr:alpha/beta hydrolase [Streptomyces sp. DSM 44915]MDT0266053.1 alpha/beta hydrolase [Streptomyces sp. DSM 44915]
MRPGPALISATLNTTAHLAPGLAGRAAFAVFRRATSRLPVRPAERSTMAKATAGRLAVAGTEVAVYRWGTGPRPVLLVHGWRFRAARFAPLVEALLARGESVLAFDAPGHGESAGTGTDLLELRAVIERLAHDHGPFQAVVGHSLGGLAASYTLAEAGADGRRLADRLVTIAAPAEFERVLNDFCALLRLGTRARRALRSRLERRVLPDVPDALRTLSATHRPERLTLPLMVVHDEEDRVVNVDQARLLLATFAGRADGLLTRGLGHNRILADPEVVAAVTAFALVGGDVDQRSTQPAH